MGTYGLTIEDYSKENSTTKYNIGPVNAANLIAVEASALAFRTAASAISIGSFKSERLMAYDNMLAATPASSVQAQREKKWLITYEDTTSHVVYRSELPCADLTLLATNSDEINYAEITGVVTVFISAFEEFVKSPTGGSTNVLTIKFVGRNL